MAPHTTLGNNASIIIKRPVDVVTTKDGIEIHTIDAQGLRALKENLDRPQTYTIYSDQYGPVIDNGVKKDHIEISGGLKPEQKG